MTIVLSSHSVRLDVRDWTKWHLEHPYIKKGWQHHLTPEEYDKALKEGFQGWADKHQAEYEKAVEKIGGPTGETHQIVYNEAAERAYAEASKSGKTAKQLKAAAAHKGYSPAKKFKLQGDHMSQAEHLGVAHGYMLAAQHRQAAEAAGNLTPSVSAVPEASPEYHGPRTEPYNDSWLVAHHRMENHSGTSNKFYEAGIYKNGPDGQVLLVTAYGSTKPGSHVTTSIKVMASLPAAYDAYDKLNAQKTNQHGYHTVTSGDMTHMATAVEAHHAKEATTGGTGAVKLHPDILSKNQYLDAKSAAEDGSHGASIAVEKHLAAGGGYSAGGTFAPEPPHGEKPTFTIEPSVSAPKVDETPAPPKPYKGPGPDPEKVGEILQAPGALAVLADVFGPYHNTPLSGGCGVTVEALKKLYPHGKVVAVVIDGGPEYDKQLKAEGSLPMVHHYALKIGPDQYVDGGGLRSAAQLTTDSEHGGFGVGHNKIIPATAALMKKNSQIDIPPGSAQKMYDYIKGALAGEAKPGGGGFSHTMPTKPSDLAAMEKLAPSKDNSLGSNGGQWYKRADGTKILVKPGQTNEHIENEVAVNAVYEAAGIPIPDYSIIKGGTAQHFATMQMPGYKEWDEQIGKVGKDKVQADARLAFGLDALTSNYDALGLVNDNSKIDDEGHVLRLDNGGGGKFRAMGGNKPTWHVGGWDDGSTGTFGPDYESLRVSPQGKLLYGAEPGSHDDDINASLASAATLDLGKVDEIMKARGVSASYRKEFLAVLKDRQDHIKKLPQIQALLDNAHSESKGPNDTSASAPKINDDDAYYAAPEAHKNGVLAAKVMLDNGQHPDDVFDKGDEHKNGTGDQAIQQHAYGVGMQDGVLEWQSEHKDELDGPMQGTPASPDHPIVIHSSNLKPGDIFQTHLEGKTFTASMVLPDGAGGTDVVTTDGEHLKLMQSVQVIGHGSGAPTEQAKALEIKSAKDVVPGDKVHFTTPEGQVVGSAEQPIRVENTYTSSKGGKVALSMRPNPGDVKRSMVKLPEDHPVVVHHVAGDAKPNVKVGSAEITHDDAVKLQKEMAMSVGSDGNPTEFTANTMGKLGIKDVNTGAKPESFQWIGKIPKQPGLDNDAAFLHELTAQLDAADHPKVIKTIKLDHPIGEGPESGDIGPAVGAKNPYQAGTLHDAWELGHADAMKNPVVPEAAMALAQNHAQKSMDELHDQGGNETVDSAYHLGAATAYTDMAGGTTTLKPPGGGPLEYQKLLGETPGEVTGKTVKELEPGDKVILGDQKKMVMAVPTEEPGTGGLLKVELDDGTTQLMHPDHEPIMATANWKEAQHLKPGDEIKFKDKTGTFTVTKVHNGPGSFLLETTNDNGVPNSFGGSSLYNDDTVEVVGHTQQIVKSLNRPTHTVDKDSQDYKDSYLQALNSGTTVPAKMATNWQTEWGNFPDEHVQGMIDGFTAAAAAQHGGMAPGAGGADESVHTVKAWDLAPGDKIKLHDHNGTYTVTKVWQGGNFQVEATDESGVPISFGGATLQPADDVEVVHSAEGAPAQPVVKPKPAPLFQPTVPTNPHHAGTPEAAAWDKGFAAVTKSIGGKHELHHEKAASGHFTIHQQMTGKGNTEGAATHLGMAHAHEAHAANLTAAKKVLGSTFKSDQSFKPVDVTGKNLVGTARIRYVQGYALGKNLTAQSDDPGVYLGQALAALDKVPVLKKGERMLAQGRVDGAKQAMIEAGLMDPAINEPSASHLVESPHAGEESYAPSSWHSKHLSDYDAGYADAKQDLQGAASEDIQSLMDATAKKWYAAPAESAEEAALQGTMNGATQVLKDKATAASTAGTKKVADLKFGEKFVNGNGKTVTVLSVTKSGSTWMVKYQYESGMSAIHTYGSAETVDLPGSGTVTPSASRPVPKTKQSKVMVKNLKVGDQVLLGGPGNTKPYKVTGKTATGVKLVDANGTPDSYSPGTPTYKVTKINSTHPLYIHSGGSAASTSSVTPSASPAPSFVGLDTSLAPEEFKAAFEKAYRLKNWGATEKVPQRSIVSDEALMEMPAYKVAFRAASAHGKEMSPQEAEELQQEARLYKGRALSAAAQAAALGTADGYIAAHAPVVSKGTTEKKVNLDEMPEYATTLDTAQQEADDGATSKDLYRKAGLLALKPDNVSQAQAAAYQSMAEQVDQAENFVPQPDIHEGNPEMTPEQVAYMKQKATEGQGLPKPGADSLDLWAYDQGRAQGLVIGNIAMEGGLTASDIEAGAIAEEELAKSTVGLVSAKHWGAARMLHRVAVAKHEGGGQITSNANVLTPKPDVQYHPPGSVSAPGSTLFGNATEEAEYTGDEITAFHMFTGPYRFSTSSAAPKNGGGAGTGSDAFYCALNTIMAEGFTPAPADPVKKNGTYYAEVFLNACNTKSVPSQMLIYRGTHGGEWKGNEFAQIKATVAAGGTVQFSLPISSCTYNPDVGIYAGKPIHYFIDQGALTMNGTYKHGMGEGETNTGGLMEIYKIQKMGSKTIVYMRQVVHYAN